MTVSGQLLAIILLLFAIAEARAQELKAQAVPFTALLDFHNSNSTREAFPIWLEKWESHTQKSPAGKIDTTVFRLRFRRFASLNNELLLRLYFDDQQPIAVTGWDEIGNRVFGPSQLGQSLGLPASETVIVPMSKVDYIDLEVHGDGLSLRRALLSTVGKVEIRETFDLGTVSQLLDPFDNSPLATPRVDDTLLYGRVKATLDRSSTKLSEENNHTSIYEFRLASQPSLAVVTFEILNADINSPPQLSANDHGIGPGTLLLPDLADPGYQSRLQPLKADVAYHYEGWLKCQKLVRGSDLLNGVNHLQIQSDSRSDVVAIRAVEVQLKYTENAKTP
jgi:hypothetical protein